MDKIIMIALLNNAALLLVLSAIYEVTYLQQPKYHLFHQIAKGSLITLVCIAIMTIPFTLQPGLVYDTRSILISTSALIFGPIPTLITVVGASAFRLCAGGVGTLPGLLVIITSAMIGLAWRRWLYPKSKKWRWLNIYAMSTTVHATMLACMLTLPYPTNLNAIREIAVPVMLIYPVASILLSLLLLRQQEIKSFQDQLKQSEERFQMLFNKAPLGYQSMDVNGYIINVNQQWLDTLGYSLDEVIGKWFGHFLAPEYREAFRQRFPVFKAQGQIHSEFEMLHKNGRSLFISFEGKIGYDFDGKFKQTHCIMQDITEQKKSEAALINSEMRYRRLFEAAIDGILIIDAKSGKIMDVNPFFIELLGYSKEQLIGKIIWDISLLKDVVLNRNIFLGLQQKEYIYYEDLLLQSADGQRINVEFVGNMYFVDDQKVLQCNIRDITDRKKAEEKLFYLSYHDYLTGLYNRRYFEEEIERLDVKSQLPLSVITGDINGLKLINDTFGELEGDKVIIETARLLRRQFRKGSVLARTGGDEFSILLPKTDSKTAFKIIQEIQTACNAFNMNISNEAFHINLSLGVGTKDNMDNDFLQTIKAAENDMYQSKLLEKKSSHSAIISSIKATMFEKSHETEAHAERLVTLSRKVGLSLNLSQTEIDNLELLATLHDIGKVGVADQILNKPGKLNNEEWAEMKKHPEIGYRIATSTPELTSIADYILSHHERWDGSGYPQNIAGNQIPLLSRIIAIIDAYDAMTQDRPYRKAIANKDAINEIIKNKGTQFDPEIVKIFVKSIN